MNHLIVGVGAIGSVLCASLQQNNVVYGYAHRPNLKLPSLLKTHQTTLLLDWVIHEKAHSVDCIWFTGKAFHVESAAIVARQYPNAILVLLHNGMGPQQTMNAEFGHRLVLASTSCGAIKSNRQTVIQTGIGETFYGYSQALKDDRRFKAFELQLQNNDYMNFKSANNIELKLWKKLAVNACINYITASEQCKNGALLDEMFSEPLNSIIEEINNIAAEHSQFQPFDDLLGQVRHVASKTADNCSSMAEDIRLGRPTENDFIMGYLIKLANELNIHTPVLKSWHHRIAELEANHPNPAV